MKELCADIKSDIDIIEAIFNELIHTEYKNSTMISHGTVFLFNDLISDFNSVSMQ